MIKIKLNNLKFYKRKHKIQLNLQENPNKNSKLLHKPPWITRTVLKKKPLCLRLLPFKNWNTWKLKSPCLPTPPTPLPTKTKLFSSPSTICRISWSLRSRRFTKLSSRLNYSNYKLARLPVSSSTVSFNQSCKTSKYQTNNT